MESPAPRTRPCRRFTLLDGMILAAAPAVGLGVLRVLGPLDEWEERLPVAIGAGALSWDQVDMILDYLLVSATPLAVTLTLAVLALRLRRPRPPWRRLARQPGLMAGLALVVGWLASAAFTVVHILKGGPFQVPNGFNSSGNPAYWLETFAAVGPALGGFAVAICWATLAVVGRWRAEAGWLDRLGRLVGVAWIALAMAAAYDLSQDLL